jgi:hypothetical protein
MRNNEKWKMENGKWKMENEPGLQAQPDNSIPAVEDIERRKTIG